MQPSANDNTRIVRFVRYVDKPLTLSDGTHLPSGSMIEAPHSSIVSDPTLYSNPEVGIGHMTEHRWPKHIEADEYLVADL
jgi:hypothetical protein